MSRLACTTMILNLEHRDSSARRGYTLLEILISMAVFLPLLFSRVSLTQAAPTRRLAAQGV